VFSFLHVTRCIRLEASVREMFAAVVCRMYFGLREIWDLPTVANGASADCCIKGLPRQRYPLDLLSITFFRRDIAHSLHTWTLILPP
jgi:hypothetical protein